MNALADEISRAAEDDWDTLVARLKSARTDPSPRMSEEDEEILLRRIWDYKLRGKPWTPYGRS